MDKIFCLFFTLSFLCSADHKLWAEKKKPFIFRYSSLLSPPPFPALALESCSVEDFPNN